jgi:predicted nucleic acid-binding protein
LRLALDTNILAYAEGVNGESMRHRTLNLLDRLGSADVVVPAQALGELFNVLVRKARWDRSRAWSAIMNWQDAYPVAETSSSVIAAAAGLAATHGLSIWDSVVIAAAASANCRLLLSEDMQDGFTWNGLTISNPYGDNPHALFASLFGPTLA